MEDLVLCPECGISFPLHAIETHANSHYAPPNSFQSDEDLAKQLQSQEDQALSETAALNLVQNDIHQRDKRDSRSPLSAVVTTPEQIALALQKQNNNNNNNNNNNVQNIPVAGEFEKGFLTFVDTTRRFRSKEEEERDAAGISHVVLYDIDNCGGEFEQMADAYQMFPKILVYVVGGPNLPNVANVKLPIFAEMHQTKRMHVIPMLKKGRNAADFVLSFYGGVLHERLPIQIPFVIVSKDKGLQNLIEHLGLLGRAAQLISSDFIKHLSVKPIIQPITTTTTTTTTTTSTTTSTNTTDNNSNNTNTNNNNIAPGTAQLTTAIGNVNPFAESATEFSLEQAVWFVVSGMSKTEGAQRPKTRSKLDNVVGGFIKRIPGKKPDSINIPAIINGMESQNFIVLEGSKVMYLF